MALIVSVAINNHLIDVRAAIRKRPMNPKNGQMCHYQVVNDENMPMFEVDFPYGDGLALAAHILAHDRNGAPD